MSHKSANKNIFAESAIAIAVMLSVYFMLAFIILAFMRMNFPFDMEWAEGVMVDQVRRVLNGYPLYAEPSVENIPFPYTPLYIYLGALLTKIFGVDYTPLRLINIFSTVGIMTVLFLLVYRETQKKSYGIIAAGLFAATYNINAYWFDLARVDMLYIFLVIWAAYLVRYGENIKSFILAAIIAILAFFTKQTALGPIFALIIYSLLFKRPFAYWFAGAFIIGSIGITLILDIVYNGWYIYFTYTFPSHHGIISSRLETFWYRDLIAPLFAMLIACTFYFASCYKKHDRQQFWFSFLLFSSLAAVSFLSRIKIGGALNTLIPLHLGSVLLTGYAFGCVLDSADKTSYNNLAKKLVLSALVIVQFFVCMYEPQRFIPPENGISQGEKALEKISEIPGNVWVPRFNNLTSRLYKGYGAHASLLNDIFKVKETRHHFIEKMTDPIENKYFSAIFVNHNNIPKFARKQFEENYRITDDYIEVIQWQSKDGWYFSRENMYLPK